MFYTTPVFSLWILGKKLQKFKPLSFYWTQQRNLHIIYINEIGFI